MSDAGAPGFRSNRRDVLKTATGLAAAAVVAGALIEPNGASAAPKGSPVSGERLTLRIEDSNSVEAYSFSWGVANAGSSGSGGGAGAGKATLLSAVVTKGIDALSAQLQQSVFTGKHYQSITVAVTDSKGKELFSYRFTDAFIAKVGVIVDPSSAGVTEKIEIEYAAVSMNSGGASFSSP